MEEVEQCKNVYRDNEEVKYTCISIYCHIIVDAERRKSGNVNITIKERSTDLNRGNVFSFL